jgi:K(+)-stimulated pyrophosphate-energized sodium pump
MEAYISMPPIFGLFGLLIALVIYFIVVSYDEGSEKVKKIADQIHLGAMVFMRREYTYLFFFVLVLIALSYFALGFNTASRGNSRSSVFFFSRLARHVFCN